MEGALAGVPLLKRATYRRGTRDGRRRQRRDRGGAAAGGGGWSRGGEGRNEGEGAQQRGRVFYSRASEGKTRGKEGCERCWKGDDSSVLIERTREEGARGVTLGATLARRPSRGERERGKRRGGGTGRRLAPREKGESVFFFPFGVVCEGPPLHPPHAHTSQPTQRRARSRGGGGRGGRGEEARERTERFGWPRNWRERKRARQKEAVFGGQEGWGRKRLEGTARHRERRSKRRVRSIIEDWDGGGGKGRAFVNAECIPTG